jgi:hypothetical protein
LERHLLPVPSCAAAALQDQKARVISRTVGPCLCLTAMTGLVGLLVAWLS